MVRAYVLIEMVAGHSMRLAQALRNNEVVQTVDRVTGPYDVIVVMSADNMDIVTDAINDDIHTIEGVIRTTTCVVLE